MSRKLYVGNLPYSFTAESLELFFSSVGQVLNAKVIMDQFTNRSKGFGFVEMETEDLAAKAIEKLHEADAGGRKLKVSVAVERQGPPAGRR